MYELNTDLAKDYYKVITERKEKGIYVSFVCMWPYLGRKGKKELVRDLKKHLP